MFRRNDGPKNPDDQIKRDGINNSPESKGPQLDKSVNALEKKDPPANKQGGEKFGQNPEKTLKTPPANKPETRKTEKLTPPPANKSEKKEREREFMQPAPPKKEAKQMMIGRNLENRAAPAKKEGVANKAEKNLRTPPARKPDVRAEAKKTEAEKKDQPKVNEKKLDWNVDKIKDVCQKVNEAKDTKEAKQKYYTKDIAQKIQKAEKQLEQSIKNKDEEINKLDKNDPDYEKKRESLQEEKEKRMDQLDQVREAGKEVKDFREGQRLDQTDKALTENYRKAKDEGLSEKQRQEVMSPQAEQALEKHKEDLKNRIDGINEKMDKLEKDGKKDSKEYYDLKDERFSREKQLAAADLMLGETKDFVRETAKENSKDRLHAERSESHLGKKRDLQKDQDCVRYNDAAIKSLEKDKTKAVQERDNVRAEIADMVNNYSEDALRQKPEFKEKMKEYDALCDKVEGYDSQIKNLKNCNERLVEINGKDEAGKDRLSVNRFDAQADDKKIAETIEAVSERVKLDNNDKKPDEKEKQENKALAEKTEREVIPALKEQISGLDYEISAAENYLKNHNDEGMQDYKKDLEKEREDKAQQLDYLEKGAKVLSGEASDQEKERFKNEQIPETKREADFGNDRLNVSRGEEDPLYTMKTSELAETMDRNGFSSQDIDAVFDGLRASKEDRPLTVEAKKNLESISLKLAMCDCSEAANAVSHIYEPREKVLAENSGREHFGTQTEAAKPLDRVVLTQKVYGGEQDYFRAVRDAGDLGSTYLNIGTANFEANWKKKDEILATIASVDKIADKADFVNGIIEKVQNGKNLSYNEAKELKNIRDVLSGKNYLQSASAIENLYNPNAMAIMVAEGGMQHTRPGAEITAYEYALNKMKVNVAGKDEKGREEKDRFVPASEIKDTLKTLGVSAAKQDFFEGVMEAITNGKILTKEQVQGLKELGQEAKDRKDSLYGGESTACDQAINALDNLSNPQKLALRYEPGNGFSRDFHGEGGDGKRFFTESEVKAVIKVEAGIEEKREDTKASRSLGQDDLKMETRKETERKLEDKESIKIKKTRTKSAFSAKYKNEHQEVSVVSNQVVRESTLSGQLRVLDEKGNVQFRPKVDAKIGTSRTALELKAKQFSKNNKKFHIDVEVALGKAESSLQAKAELLDDNGKFKPKLNAAASLEALVGEVKTDYVALGGAAKVTTGVSIGVGLRGKIAQENGVLKMEFGAAFGLGTSAAFEIDTKKIVSSAGKKVASAFSNIRNYIAEARNRPQEVP